MEVRDQIPASVEVESDVSTNDGPFDTETLVSVAGTSADVPYRRVYHFNEKRVTNTASITVWYEITQKRRQSLV